jgi:hypothetical protein
MFYQSVARWKGTRQLSLSAVSLSKKRLLTLLSRQQQATSTFDWFNTDLCFMKNGYIELAIKTLFVPDTQ